MTRYIYQYRDWPTFTWDSGELLELLGEVRKLQGFLLGRMESMGFNLKANAGLNTLTLDVLKSSEIESEILDQEQVRSSIARRMGLDIAGLVPSDRKTDGIVDMMFDATTNSGKPLTGKRLYRWHSGLFPDAGNQPQPFRAGRWRDDKTGPMQVVSGAMGREKVHFQAPGAEQLPMEMKAFVRWFNSEIPLDPAIKAAIAHLWFVTLHPFDDGNGRIARALSDMLLARSDGSEKRFYSMSAQIRKERKQYYDVLERTQKGDMEITRWLKWFLNCLLHAILDSEDVLSKVLFKATFWNKMSNYNINDRQKLMLNRLLDGFKGNLTSSKWAKITKCSSDTALRDIQDLISKGILIREEAGGRSTSYSLKT